MAGARYRIFVSLIQEGALLWLERCVFTFEQRTQETNGVLQLLVRVIYHLLMMDNKHRVGLFVVSTVIYVSVHVSVRLVIYLAYLLLY